MVGIIAADSRQVTKRHLRAIGIDEAIPVKIVGMENQPNFCDAILNEKGVLDFEKVEQEVIQVAEMLVDEDDKVKAILLECSNLPPYAAEVQKAVNLPVYDFITMINHVFSAVVRRKFDGFV